MSLFLEPHHLKQIEHQTRKNYIDELYIHCQKKFPFLTNQIERVALKSILARAINKAKDQGFTQRGPVLFYIELMIFLGWNLDTDPQYYWVQDFLTKNKDQSEIERSERLHTLLEEYLNAIYGEQDQHLTALATRLDTLTLSTLLIRPENIKSELLTFLKSIYPEKMDSIPPKIAHNIYISLLDTLQEQYPYQSPKWYMGIIVLQFLYGYNFDKDLFLPFTDREKAFSESFEPTSLNVLFKTEQEIEQAIRNYRNLKFMPKGV